MRKIQIFLLTNLFCLLFTMTVFAGAWEHDQQGWRYQKENGSYPSGTWQVIDNKWYYFNENGYMQTGWIQNDGTRYYCDLNGGLVTERWINGIYYVGSDGALYVNTTTPDGTSVDENGKKVNQSYGQSQYNVYVGDYVNEEEISTWESYKGYNFEISKIADGKIYGSYRQDTGAYSGYTADFTQGVAIDGNGNFVINTRYEDAHSNYDSVNREYIGSVDYETFDCSLALKDGKPIIRTSDKIYLRQ